MADSSMDEAFLFLPKPVLREYRTLESGYKFPAITFGTSFIDNYENIFNALDVALETGYRSFDLPPLESNEIHVGEALKILLPKYSLSRGDICIITKIPLDCYEEYVVRNYVQKSLVNLDTPYVDFCLIFWPGARDTDPSDELNKEARLQSYHSLKILHKEGFIKHIGVCNFTPEQISSLMEEGDDLKPVLAQAEIHPRFPQKDLLAAAEEMNMLVQMICYPNCFHKRLLITPEVVRIAGACGKQPTQVVLKWILNKGALVIIQSEDPTAIRDNFQLFNFALGKLEMQLLDSISVREKYLNNTICIQ